MTRRADLPMELDLKASKSTLINARAACEVAEHIVPSNLAILAYVLFAIIEQISNRIREEPNSNHENDY